MEEEDTVEEFFRQLWSIPTSERPRVPDGCGGRCLVWIRRDLVEAWTIHLDDCFLVSRFQRFDKPPRKLNFTRDIWAKANNRESYVEVLKRRTMADGGRWIWQPDPPRAQGRPQQAQAPRGRGAGQGQATTTSDPAGPAG
jgi:hypothetical protein